MTLLRRLLGKAAEPKQETKAIDPAVAALAIPAIGFVKTIKEARVAGVPDLMIQQGTYQEGKFFVLARAPESRRPEFFYTPEDQEKFRQAGLRIYDVNLTGGSSGDQGTRYVIDPNDLFTAKLQGKITVNGESQTLCFRHS